jgi:hypothetical protein
MPLYSIDLTYYAVYFLRPKFFTDIFRLVFSLTQDARARIFCKVVYPTYKQ